MPGSPNSILRAGATALMLSALLAGCAQKQYTPSEYREAMRNHTGIFASMTAVETFDAPRPYTQVTDTLRRKSKECLDVTVESSGTVRQGNMWVREHSRTEYKPIFTVGKDKAELTVQANSHNVYGVDVAPAGKSSTRVTVYRAKVGPSNAINTAVQGWVKGNAVACPNLNG
jgi:hypothetical protein